MLYRICCATEEDGKFGFVNYYVTGPDKGTVCDNILLLKDSGEINIDEMEIDPISSPKDIYDEKPTLEELLEQDSEKFKILYVSDFESDEDDF